MMSKINEGRNPPFTDQRTDSENDPVDDIVDKISKNETQPSVQEKEESLLRGGPDNAILMPDPKRVIYDLKELHDMPLRVRPFFSQRQFIHFGYRAHVNMGFCRCASTIFKAHCETGSVWTHALSSAYFTYQLYKVITDQAPYDELSTQQSKIFMAMGCLGTIICAMTSTIYH